MIALDAGVLSVILYPQSPIPKDFKTGLDIDHAKERVDQLVEEIRQSGDRILIPTPALSEALVVVAPDVQKYLDELESQACFKIAVFGTRAAVEIALRVKHAKQAGDKKEGLLSAWDKVKYDRQIVAIAKVEGATAIYSTDKDVHDHGKLWGLPVYNLSDLPIPLKQHNLFQEEQRKTEGPKLPAQAADPDDDL